MELRRIVAEDATSAREQALQLFGRDALIVSSQSLPKNRIEVIVAVETSSEPAANDGPSGSTATISPDVTDDSIDSQIPRRSDGQPGTSKAHVDSVPLKAADFHDLMRRERSQLQDPPTPQQSTQDQQGTQDLIEQLRNELRTLRRELDDLRRAQASTIDWAERLSALGLEDDLVRQIIAVTGKSLPEDWDLDRLSSTIMALILGRLSDEPTPGVQLFFGEPSVARGTAIVTLAQAHEARFGAGTATITVFGAANTQRWNMMLQQSAQAGIQCLRSTDMRTLKSLAQTFGLDSGCLFVDAGETQDDAQPTSSDAEDLTEAPTDWKRYLVIPASTDHLSLNDALGPEHPWDGLVVNAWDGSAQDLSLLGALTSKEVSLRAILDKDHSGTILPKRSMKELSDALSQRLVARLKQDSAVSSHGFDDQRQVKLEPHVLGN